MKWRNRIVGSAEVPPDSLLAHPMNWRRHSEYQEAGLKKVLREVGWVRPVLVNKTTGLIVDGHLRVEMAKRQKEATIPVEYVELSEAEELEVLASLDPLAALAEPDPSLLKALAEEVPSAYFWPRGALDKILGADVPESPIAFPEDEHIEGENHDNDFDMADRNRPSSADNRYPLAIVLPLVAYREWQKYKENGNYGTDTLAFLALLKEVDI